MARGDLYRAVLEGIAAGTAHVLETCAELGAAPRKVMAVGGGMKNPVWLQATSDFSGTPQVLSEISIGASYGDAYLAARWPSGRHNPVTLPAGTRPPAP